MTGTSTSTGPGTSRPPVTETQILPPQIPPQAMRPSAASTPAPIGASLAAAGTATPASTAQSASGSSVGAGASPPGVQKTRAVSHSHSHSQPKTTPIPAPIVPLVQETPVPAPQIPRFNASLAASAAGSPPRETKVVPPVPPTSNSKAPKQAPKATATPSSSQAAVKQESTTPERKQEQRAWSPPRPPISPHLAPADMPAHLRPLATGSGTFYKPEFSAGRPQFKYTEAARESAAASAHATAHDQAAAARTGAAADNTADATAQLPPGPVPIDFGSNPDVLALSSTLSILQIQRKKALDDIRKLQIAKEAALANPEAFLRQLQNVPGSGLGAAGPATGGGRASASASRSTPRPPAADRDGDVAMASEQPDGSSSNNVKRGSTASSSSASSEESAAANPGSGILDVVDLQSLPKPQNVVRMPHINWNQYGVVGQGLDKLHAEQIRRPPVGQPADASVLQGGDGHDGHDGPRIAFGQVNFGGGSGSGGGSGAAASAGGSGSRAVYTFGGYETAAEAADNAPLAPVYRGMFAPYDPLVDVIEADQPGASHRSSAGSTPGENGPQSAFGASFSSAATGAGTGRGRGASDSSNTGAAQPFVFSSAATAASSAAAAAAAASNGPPAASTRRSKSAKNPPSARR